MVEQQQARPSPLDRLALAGIAAFVAALGLGVLVPLYTDEVATRIVQSRVVAEGWRLLSLFPQCASGFLLDAPLTWYPAAALYAALYGPLPPLGVRLAGIGLSLAWLAALAWWCSLRFPGRGAAPRALAAQLALLAPGVLPLTLALARPEQWLLLVATLFLALPAWAARGPGSGRRDGLLLAAFLLLDSLLVFSHPKAILLLPLALAVAWGLFARRNRVLLALAVAFALAGAWQSYTVAKAVTRCDDAPILAGLFRQQTAPLSLLATSPAAFAGELLDNARAAPGKIAGHAAFQDEHQSGWLPPSPGAAGGAWTGALNTLGAALLAATLGLAVLLPPLAGVLGKALPRWRPPAGTALPAAALWLALAGHLALFREVNFYSGALPVALAALLLAMLLPAREQPPRPAAAGRALLAALLAFALANQATLALQAGPGLYAAARAGAATGELQDQPMSVNVFGFAATRERVRALAEDCGIEGDGARRAVVDDLTWFAFSGLREPLHAVYTYPGGWGADIGLGSRAFLARQGSRAFIAQCTWTPGGFMDFQVMRDGNLCCINLARWDNPVP